MARKAFGYIKSLGSRVLSSGASYPEILSYLITDKCNSRCITCSVWHNKGTGDSLTADLLEKQLQKDLFSRVKHIGISGGEPSTFVELKSHIRRMIAALPSLQTLSITTNCINSDYWIQNIEEINEYCKSKKIYFQLNISLDGVGELHDQIRGVAGNFSNTEKVLSFMIDRNIPCQIHSTIAKYNVYHVNALLDYACSKGVEIIFRLASEINRLNNKELIPFIALNKRELSFFCDFLISSQLLASTPSPGRRLYYKSLRKQLLGDGSRIAPCYFKNVGVVLSSDGQLYHCSRFHSPFSSLADTSNLAKFQDQGLNEAYVGETCKTCYHDQTGLWRLSDVLSEITLPQRVLVNKLYQFAKYACLAWMQPTARKPKSEAVRSIAIVGMYGGEHVGDAAILGGVIKRMQQRYPTIHKVSIYSFRKDRTECWVENLSALKEMDICVYDDDQQFVDQIAKSQLLVWAGGPLMEIPVLLSRNYYFIRKAQSEGCRIELEGIGYGPVNTKLGKLILARILRSAERITVRSVNDKTTVSAISNKVDSSFSYQDPAFDYLSLIPQTIRISQQEAEPIEKIIGEREGRRIVALNMRPLWNRYGSTNSFDFNHFLQELSLLLQDFMSNGDIILFFPMNADQFGFSDLEVAYKIQKLVNNHSCFRILETEPTIDQLVYLLRNVDYSICMRFHAAIFSLSQGVRTLGIDYSLNGKGKIASLFENKGNPLFINIREFNHEVITNVLNHKQV